jgi:hypothetical protein
MAQKTTTVHDKLFSKKLKEREYSESVIIRHKIKTMLTEFLSFTFEGNYFIKLTPEKWHKIFNTEELNRSGITYDERYCLEKLKKEPCEKWRIGYNMKNELKQKL